MTVRGLGSALSAPWGLFVAVFLYYVGLTLVALGVSELSVLFVAVTYLVPLAGYLAFLAIRAVRKVVGAPVVLWPTHNLILH